MHCILSGIQLINAYRINLSFLTKLNLNLLNHCDSLGANKTDMSIAYNIYLQVHVHHEFHHTIVWMHACCKSS